jgi:hypothetical protein
MLIEARDKIDDSCRVRERERGREGVENPLDHLKLYSPV